MVKKTFRSLGGSFKTEIVLHGTYEELTEEVARLMDEWQGYCPAGGRQFDYDETTQEYTTVVSVLNSCD